MICATRAGSSGVDPQPADPSSARSKTIKLADLINNCTDITAHDPRFGRVFLDEMAALLEVLSDGDATLYRRAQKTHARCLERLAAPDREGEFAATESLAPVDDLDPAQQRVSRLFTEAFSARDIASPLRSFDAESSASRVFATMAELDLDVSGIRIEGTVKRYLRRGDQPVGSCLECSREFSRGQIISGDAPLSDVIHVLTRHESCFVELLGQVEGVIARNDVNGPIVRVWLFGIITIVEMALMRRIRADYPDHSWRGALSPSRLEKALVLFEERRRRNRSCELLDCLQLSDKAQILIRDPSFLEWMRVDSRSVAKGRIKEIESLRNHLAHAQDIVAHDWAQIARMAHRVEELLKLSAERTDELRP